MFSRFFRPTLPAVLIPLLALPACKEKPAAPASSDQPDLSAIQQLILPAPGPAPIDPNDPASTMVRIHCQRCHQLPDPKHLTQKMWVNRVLPEMGCYLGVQNYIPQYKNFEEVGRNDAEEQLFKDRALYPTQALLPQPDWDQIVNYFLRNSPAEVPASNNKRQPPLPAGRFEASFIGPPDPKPEMALIHIDEARQRFFSSNNTDDSLSVYDATGKLLGTNKGPGTFVDVHLDPGTGIQHFLAIGILNPNDTLAGSVWTNPDGNSLDALEKSAIPPLKRPVSAVWHDFDHDGDDEIVVAEYGNKTGQLSLLHQDESGAWQQKALNSASGNITVRLADINQDGWEDLVVLRAQESEDVLVYYNTGQLGFRQSHVLRFPPGWGSNELELADLNNDGHQDIIIANGDNADSTHILKNYHGIRIFLNNGRGRFDHAFTFPLHGAYGVRALDHDLDGDRDLVAISTFPDFPQDPDTIILLDQTAPMKFQPYGIPQSRQSRWMVMDAGDLDGDGDLDLLFAPNIPGPSGLPPAMFDRAAALPGPFLLLKNLAKP